MNSIHMEMFCRAYQFDFIQTSELASILLDLHGPASLVDHIFLKNVQESNMILVGFVIGHGCHVKMFYLKYH